MLVYYYLWVFLLFFYIVIHCIILINYSKYVEETQYICYNSAYGLLAFIE